MLLLTEFWYCDLSDRISCSLCIWNLNCTFILIQPYVLYIAVRIESHVHAVFSHEVVFFLVFLNIRSNFSMQYYNIWIVFEGHPVAIVQCVFIVLNILFVFLKYGIYLPLLQSKMLHVCSCTTFYFKYREISVFRE